jgi:lipase chaperone LimK
MKESEKETTNDAGTNEEYLQAESKQDDQELQMIKISKETHAFIKCLNQLDKTFDTIREALEILMGKECASNIMSKDISDKIHSIREGINNYICDSIWNDVCEEII